MYSSYWLDVQIEQSDRERCEVKSDPVEYPCTLLRPLTLTYYLQYVKQGNA